MGSKDPVPNGLRVSPGTFSCLGLPACVPTWGTFCLVETHSSAVCVAAAEDWPGQVGTQPPERTPGKKEEAPGRLHRATPREIQEPGGQSWLGVPRPAQGTVLVVGQ